MEKDGLELLIVFVAFIVSLLFRIAYKYKWPLNGMKFGVIIINPVLNNRNKILEGFIEKELIKKGAKVAPVGFRILRDISKIEDLKSTTFYHKEKLDFLIVGELETEFHDLSEFIKECVKVIKYSLNFKIFDYESGLYTGMGYAESFKFLDDSINLVFEKISEDVVNSIHIDSENRKYQKTLVENVKNNSK